MVMEALSVTFFIAFLIVFFLINLVFMIMLMIISFINNFIRGWDYNVVFLVFIVGVMNGVSKSTTREQNKK